MDPNESDEERNNFSEVDDETDMWIMMQASLCSLRAVSLSLYISNEAGGWGGDKGWGGGPVDAGGSCDVAGSGELGVFYASIISMEDQDLNRWAHLDPVSRDGECGVQMDRRSWHNKEVLEFDVWSKSSVGDWHTHTDVDDEEPVRDRQRESERYYNGHYRRALGDRLYNLGYGRGESSSQGVVWRCGVVMHFYSNDSLVNGARAYQRYRISLSEDILYYVSLRCSAVESGGDTRSLSIESLAELIMGSWQSGELRVRSFNNDLIYLGCICDYAFTRILDIGGSIESVIVGVELSDGLSEACAEEIGWREELFRSEVFAVAGIV
ncbi:hypothetical protein Tco_0529368 [Tanacetum coccineum]